MILQRAPARFLTNFEFSWKTYADDIFGLAKIFGRISSVIAAATTIILIG
jgi:hypothetical protein